MSFKIMTDIACDLPYEYTKGQDISVIAITTMVDGKEYQITNDPNVEGYLDPHEFYNMLEGGADSTTAQINPDIMMDAMKPMLDAGEDVLYITFSSALSGIYNNACMAAEQLREEYPQRKILVVDSLCASLGYGLLVWCTAKRKNEGATIEETAAYAESLRQKMQHWFTVLDLGYLTKGGRISKTAAALGTVLAIKPVLNVDTMGRLILREKVQGRKKALKSLLEHMKAENADVQNYPVMISHCDAWDEANKLASQVEEAFGVKPIIINYISPVIGTHVGKGTMSLFYYADVDRK